MIPIIIPAYEPDQRLIGLLKELSEYPYGPVILVNDGSGSAYEDIFKAAKNLLSEKAILLTHEVNRGKGRALKTAFQYILEHLPCLLYTSFRTASSLSYVSWQHGLLHWNSP